MEAAVEIAVVAFGVVFMGMVILTAIVFGFRRAAVREAERDEAARAAADLEPAVDEETMAVISAAVACALRKPVRIHRVHLRTGPSSEAWSRAGRMDILVSHHVGKNQ
jgi:Na+-transporting methylmalonyl-CoA/oxaloacetate decarboxylase gamma subunit